MAHYKNSNGNSPVLEYEIGYDFIDIIYKDSMYHFTYASAGKNNIEEMKSLAKQGYGLNSYLMRHCPKDYAYKTKL